MTLHDKGEITLNILKENSDTNHSPLHTVNINYYTGSLLTLHDKGEITLNILKEKSDANHNPLHTVNINYIPAHC